MGENTLAGWLGARPAGWLRAGRLALGWLAGSGLAGWLWAGWLALGVQAKFLFKALLQKNPLSWFRKGRRDLKDSRRPVYEKRLKIMT